ncbi:MAG: redoxin domain-containing protein [Fibrella sp.]|nr:redoxin domain-containing protein [Armatimonadota bacterium]
MRRRHLVAVVAEKLSKGLGGIDVVVDHQDPTPRSHRSDRGHWRRAVRDRRDTQREADHELRALPRTLAQRFDRATDCPVASRTAPQIARLAKRYAKRGVRFYAVYPNGLESADGIRRHARERGLPAALPVVQDASGDLARALGVGFSPEAVFVGKNGSVIYRGNIESLIPTLDATLGGKRVPVAKTRVAGCALRLAARPHPQQRERDGGAKAQYAIIAPLLAKHCVPCHRSGEVGPMPLDSHPQAASWAKAMAQYTKRREMPPWKADSHGEFQNERRLTDAEIDVFAVWGEHADFASGSPPAPKSPSPPETKPTSRWQLGQPDAVFEMPDAFTVPAEGKDVYRCFVVPTGYDSDKWVSAIEFQPGNRAIVHHINVWLDTSGKARKLDAADKSPGYVSPNPGNVPGFVSAGLLGGWVPGHLPWELPAGVGNRLPRDADVVIEVHYVTTGKLETDRTRFGLKWVRGDVRKRLHLGEITAKGFRIPAGDGAYTVETSEFVREPITLLSVTPHMHNLGRSMKAVAEYPDGTPLTLVSVSNWDFAWQMSYRYKTPVRLPQNTRIDLSAVYDNSPSNLKNPNTPPKTVRDGERTEDEMCNLFIAYTVDGE